MEDNAFFTLQQNANRIAFIPSTEFLIAHITLPHPKHIKTKKAFLYALEQNLCDDIDDLDVMVLDTTTVAIYKKSLLKSLSKNYPGITHALPDYFALPYEKNTWTVLHRHNRAIVRTGLFEGFSVEENNFDLYLEAAAEKPLTINTLPDTADLTNLAEIPELNLFENLQNYSPLFQGPFLKKWRWPIVLFLSWISVLFISELAKYMYLSHQLNTINTTLSRQLAMLYPNAKPSDNKEARLQRDMRLYSKQGDSFWSGLGTLSLLLNQSTITVTKLAYNNGQFDLVLSAPNVGKFQTFNTHLKNKNVTILANHMSSENQQFTETLSVRVAP